MARSRYIACTALLATGLLAGCSSGDPFSDEQADAGVDDRSVTQERYGALAAEVDPDAPRRAGGVDVQAQFLDARGVDVGAALDALEVWTPRRGLETGECRVASETGAAEESYEPASLHLLDVGPIEVEGPRESVSLEPRQLPDLLSSFYGVVYGSDWDDGDVETTVDYRPGEEYRFQAPGSERTGRFDVTLQAPEPVVLAAANGESLYDRETVTVERNQDLELVWETRGTEQGEVFVDVAVGNSLYGTRVQCRSDDDGVVTIPAEDLANFDRRTRLEIRRVHRTQVTVDGVEEVDFFFSTTDRIGLEFE